MERFFSKYILDNLLLLVLLNTNDAALFEGCDSSFYLRPGLTYLTSPYHPKEYPPGSSCRYEMIAPLDYDITVNCTINLDKNPDSCSTEFLYVAIDGDKNLLGSEEFCGQGQFIRKSLFRSLVLAYVSYGSTGPTGKFECQLRIAPQPCDCGWSVNEKIVNGEETKPHEYPSMVAIRDLKSYANVSCGGVIISHRYIVTAAHCTRLQPIASFLLVCVGCHDITKKNRYAKNYEVERIIEHPDYNANLDKNDIALLFTKNNIEWSRGVGPVCLPVMDAQNDFAYIEVDVLGWGTTSFGGSVSKVLRKVSLQTLKNVDCQRQMDVPIYSSEICTYDNTGSGRDSCQFDSGGPLIYRSSRQFSLGIISFGRICGLGNYALGVNTRMTSFLDWIYKTTGSQKFCNNLHIVLNNALRLYEEDFFNGCDEVYNLSVGETFLESPYYPENYPLGTSCRYALIAPIDHAIEVECTINMGPEAHPCFTQFFWISLDGDRLFRGAERICDTVHIVRKTLFRKLLMAYISFQEVGRFQCKFLVSPQPCDCGWSVNEKIINSEEAQRNEFPSIVALNDMNDKIAVFCGGVIVSHRHIITAAHCLRLHPIAANIRAYVGMHDMTYNSNTPYEALHFIERMIEHPAYYPDPLINDIAILVTTKDIEWRRGVGPICLPSSVDLQSPLTSPYVDVAGWGILSEQGTRPNVLHKATLTIVDNEDCSLFYEGYATIFPTQLCTCDESGNRRDTCQFDSGGPVIQRGARQFLLGIISFGKQCGESSFPMSVNTRVTSYMDWILQEIGNGICNVNY